MSEPRQLNDVRLLSPSFLALEAQWMRNCNAKGVAILVYETLRMNERQAWLYDSGRSRPGPILTNAKPGQSRHNPDKNGLGHAIDAAPWDWVKSVGTLPQSKLDWTPFDVPSNEEKFKQTGSLVYLDQNDWRVMVEQAEKLGIEWAGRWKGSLVEYVHFQEKA